MAASEPGALLAAGRAGRARRRASCAEFIEHGVCDDRRAHVLRRDPPGPARRGGRARAAVRRGTAPGRLDPGGARTPSRPCWAGPSPAAGSGCCSRRASRRRGRARRRAVPAGAARSRCRCYTATFPDLDGPAAHPPAVLVPLPHGTVRHTASRSASTTPTWTASWPTSANRCPTWRLVLSWAVARQLDGGGGHAGRLALSADPTALARVRDRLRPATASTIRCPLAGEGAGARPTPC